MAQFTRMVTIWRRRRVPVMPWKFEALATYNAECSRGVAHSAEYDARMAALQAEFNGWASQTVTTAQDGRTDHCH